MAVGIVTLVQDEYIRRVRVIKATFVGGDGDLVIQTPGCRTFTFQTTGVFDGGTLTLARSNDAANFGNTFVTLAHLMPGFSTVGFEDIGWLYSRFRILGGQALQNVVLTICIDE